MTRQRKPTVCLCLILAFAGNLKNETARAEDGGRNPDKPIRLYATASSFGPIGAIQSPSEFSIDGRAVFGKQMVWGSELLCTPSTAPARVEVDNVGQVILSKGAMVRLTTSSAMLDDNKHHTVLIASLKTGGITVKLEEQACAYVEAAGSAATASSGASFSIIIREGKMAVETIRGEVAVAQIRSQNEAKKIALVKEQNGTFTESSPFDDVAAREGRSFPFRVTDENDKPIPDLPVVITVSSKGLGVFPGGATTFTTTTNAQGIATAPFTAGPSPTTGTMTATVRGTNIKQTIEIRVRSRTVTPRRLIAVGAIAALAGVIIFTSPEPRPPLRQEPPPTIP